MTDDKRSISERQSLLDVKEDRDSPVCDKLRREIMENLQKNEDPSMNNA